MSTSGKESTSSERLQQSSHICVLERNPEAWSNTKSRPDVLLKHPDGCTLDQIETSRHRRRFRWEVLVIWMDDALDRWMYEQYDTPFGRLVLWTDGRPDGMTRCPDGWQGTEFSALQTV
jgi:hypothetical protein